MNNTVTFSQLITRLAKVAGTDTNTSRLYLRSFFALIEETLAKGEDVTIDGIGTFRRHSTDDAFAPESGISFIPDKTLADEINAPFAVFEPVELADGVDFSGLDAPAPAPAPAPAEETQPEPAPEPTPEAAPEPETTQVSEPVHEHEPVIIEQEEEIREEETQEEDIRQEEVTVTPAPAAAPVSAPQPRRPQWPEEAEKEPEETAVPQPEPVEDEADDEYYEEEESERPKTLRWVIYGALGVIAVAAVAYFAAVVVQPIPSFGDDEEETEATADTIATVVEEIEVEEASGTTPASGQTEIQPETAARQTEPAAQPATDAAATPAPAAKKQEVYDTIKPGYFMAQMARKHYGKAPFWVYIYEANTDVIRNPNRLSNGTRLRIPDKSTFPGANDTEKLKLAIEKQTQLNKKFD